MSDKPILLEIRKYPNRRFYDATRSRHVTLEEMHALVAAGHELRVSDSQTGADITNAVLLQILLEKDLPKLAVFPSGILHLLIRTQHQFLAPVVEQYLRQVADLQRTSAEQWAAMMRGSLAAIPGARIPGSLPPGAFDWTGAVMPGWAAPTTPEPPEAAPPPPATRPPAETGPAPKRRGRRGGSPAPAADSGSDDEMRRMREQLAELTRKVSRLTRKKPGR